MRPFSTAVGAMLLAAATVTPGAAFGSGDVATLTLTATSNAYGWLDVDDTVDHYDIRRATVSFIGGSYGGFAIAGDDPQLWTSYLRNANQPTIHGFSGTRGVLTPGRYKVRVFTDAPRVTVKIPWSAPARTLRADQPLDVTVRTDSAPAVLNQSTVAVALPMGAKPGDTVAISLIHTAIAGTELRFTLCLTLRKHTCEGATRTLGVPAAGLGLNQYSPVYGMHRWPYRTDGLHGRGEVRGTTVGSTRLLTFRFTP